MAINIGKIKHEKILIIVKRSCFVYFLDLTLIWLLSFAIAAEEGFDIPIYMYCCLSQKHMTDWSILPSVFQFWPFCSERSLLEDTSFTVIQLIQTSSCPSVTRGYRTRQSFWWQDIWFWDSSLSWNRYLNKWNRSSTHHTVSTIL